MSKESIEFIEGALLIFGALAAGYYAGSKKAVKTFGDLDNRQDNLENRLWYLENKNLYIAEREVKG